MVFWALISGRPLFTNPCTNTCIVILFRSGAMFMAVGNVAILGISALGIFIQQRALLMYESLMCFLLPVYIPL